MTDARWKREWIHGPVDLRAREAENPVGCRTVRSRAGPGETKCNPMRGSRSSLEAGAACRPLPLCAGGPLAGRRLFLRRVAHGLGRHPREIAEHEPLDLRG